MTMKTETLWQPEHQQVLFRHLLQAMSYPGRRVELTDAETPADRAALATLLDPTVSLCDKHGLLPASDWPLLAASHASAEEADFVLVDGSLPPDFEPRTGSLAEPEQSATLVLRVDALGKGKTRMLMTGPGIDKDLLLDVDGLHADWLRQRAAWVSAFPMGVDLILADARQVVAIPRTTRLELH
jgi:alpha-D-ribose 1-methylphosphonate 5-triphosphate synthase subunit PhnH